MAERELNIHASLEEIGKAVLTSITYRRYPPELLNRIMAIIETIINTPAYLSQCEQHLKSPQSNYILFFLSNIIYNLKKQGELLLTPEVLKWLGSVWMNFIKRNRAYQEMFPLIEEQRKLLKRYFPSGGSFVHQIENVNMVREDFVETMESKENRLGSMEKFYQHGSELLTWMRPTYYFLIDFYYECKMSTGKDMDGSAEIEARGLIKFGEIGYTYGDIAVLVCQTLGVLEAAYLIIKKKKSSRRIITIDGKQKFLTPSEIYSAYLDRFNSMKKEISNLNK
ncbi:MAG: hypothetical protein JXA20_08260 [Spirochaetes bacterium]|nr:hypothetical protein [Spirochaetota bacterium]